MPGLPSVACLPSSPYDTLSATLRRLRIWSAQTCILRPASSPVREGRTGVLKGNLYKLFDNASKKAFTSANILSEFRHTGL